MPVLAERIKRYSVEGAHQMPDGTQRSQEGEMSYLDNGVIYGRLITKERGTSFQLAVRALGVRTEAGLALLYLPSTHYRPAAFVLNGQVKSRDAIEGEYAGNWIYLEGLEKLPIARTLNQRLRDLTDEEALELDPREFRGLIFDEVGIELIRREGKRLRQTATLEVRPQKFIS